MTLMSFGVSAQNIGDTVILKCGARLRDKPKAFGKQIKFLEKNTTIVLLGKKDFYYNIITEDKDEGYINEIWLELKLYERTPMEITKYMYGKPDKISEYESDDYRSITYIYYCAGDKYRSINFILKPKGWKKESEHTSDCIH